MNTDELIEKAAIELKKKGIEIPEWAAYVKTGVGKVRPPQNNDWWYFRLASILRKVYLLGPIGVSKLRTKYGSRHRRGHKPPKFKKGSGNIIRTGFQQLEKLGYIKQTQIGNHKGRVITKEGKEFLNLINNSKDITNEKEVKSKPKTDESKSEKKE